MADKTLTMKRGALKSQLTRFENYFQNLDLHNLSNTAIIELRLKLEKIQAVFEQFNEVQFEIELNLKHEEPEVREAFENRFFKIVSEAELFIQSNQSSITQATSANISEQSNVKLPTIDLPHFYGNYDQWVEFRDTFNALIHRNNAISRIQKFHYLKSCLRDKAANMLSSLSVSEANYSVAWGLLNERFENVNLIIQGHISAIFDMPTIQKESHARLRQLSDNIQKHIRALNALKLPVDSWDVLLIHIVASKLDTESKREWQMYEKSEIPKFSEMIKFLNKRCEILEALAKPKFENKVRVTAVICDENEVQTSKCILCEGNHRFHNCNEFVKLTVPERTQKVKGLGLCFNCFRSNHQVRNCKAKSCNKCHRRHNVLLHLEKGSQDQGPPARNNNSINTEFPESQSVNITSHVCGQSRTILLSTATVYVYDRFGNENKFRALLDSGSQANFIRQDAFKKLFINKREHVTNIIGINKISVNSQYKCELKFYNKKQDFSLSISCIILPKITSDLPRIDVGNLKLPSDVMLADAGMFEGGPVDILLGAEVFWSLLEPARREITNGPTLCETKLGWILGGRCEVKNINNNKITANLCLDLNTQVEKFWEIENIDNVKENNLNEKICEDIFRNTYKRNSDGRFIVEMPFSENFEKLGKSRDMALKRFNNLEKRFRHNHKLKQEYLRFMSEYRDLGHMSKVEVSESDSDNYFLPHHAVFKTENNKTKIRVVFDASAKTDTGTSLNDVQHVGPTIQDELFSILVRFRQHRYVITADIVKMYRQVLIAENHRKYQLIFWRENETDPLEVYQLNTVTYGEACAPFLAVRSLTQLAYDIEKDKPSIAEIIKRDFYIDDLLTGADTVDELSDIMRTLIDVLHSGGFELSKWCTNSSKELQENSTECTTFGERDKILGIMWDPKQDCFFYSVKILNANQFNTKRLILSTVSQLFDPLGILGPIIILAKIIIQRLWKLQLEWDDPVPTEIELEWKQMYSELRFIENLRIPRKIITKNTPLVEMHGFADASERAYGACVYIRTGVSGEFTATLVCAKSRVAPTKALTLPRLELCGAVLLSKLCDKVKKSLKIQIDKYYYWTDSSVVLHWIKNTSAQWKTFIANRVSIIQSLTNTDEWYHVVSEDNPADIISRGKTPSELLNCSLWFHGPNWLGYEEARWPKQKFKFNAEIELERKHTVISSIVIESEFEFCSKYSNFKKMLNVFTFILRFINNCRNRENAIKGSITVAEQENALNKLVIIVQRNYFERDIRHLRQAGRVSNKSNILSLNPFFDENDILRVGGRLNNADFNYDKKFPILLPHDHYFTKLLLLERHKELLHCGAQTLLASIREKFWPIKGQTLVRKIVHDCVTCFRVRPQFERYKMGNLPKSRITRSRPFSICGTDFAGPFLMKDRPTRGFKLIKVYVCLFVCFSTKAVHLELVMDLSTESFLAALRRFVSRRGLCSDIHSDNGTNFVGARNELMKIYELLKNNSQSIFDHLKQQGITWHFTPARSPHFGGLWESNIKIFKSHLLKTIGLTNLLFDEFTTVLTRIESCLNSRPLCPMSEDPNDLSVLTPAHFLVGGPLASVPERESTGQQLNLLSRWERTQEMSNHFWRRWMREYINILQTRNKWRQSAENQLSVGDLVLVQQEHTPPLLWPIGRIAELYPGDDGIVRVATIKTSKGVYRRSTRRLCKLPIKTV